jgi:hypothetical protein
MIRSQLFLVLPLTACGGGLVGDWEGECATMVANTLYTYEVSIEIEDVKKGDINGAGEVIDQEDARSQGNLDGEKDGSEVTLSIHFDDGLNTGETFEIEAELTGREMKGDCSIGSRVGDIELERQ